MFNGVLHYSRLLLSKVQMCTLLSSLQNLCVLSEQMAKSKNYLIFRVKMNPSRLDGGFDGPPPFNRAKTMVNGRRKNRFRPVPARDTNCAHQADVGFLSDIVVARAQ
jgi:hypothetical protein